MMHCSIIHGIIYHENANTASRLSDQVLERMVKKPCQYYDADQVNNEINDLSPYLTFIHCLYLSKLSYILGQHIIHLSDNGH